MAGARASTPVVSARVLSLGVIVKHEEGIVEPVRSVDVEVGLGAL